MTRYKTIVSLELLAGIKSGDWLPPDGFRFVQDLGEVPGHGGESPTFRSHLVEFEDDGAPAALENQLVTPTFRAHYDEQGNQTHTTVMDRQPERWPWSMRVALDLFRNALHGSR